MSEQNNENESKPKRQKRLTPRHGDIFLPVSTENSRHTFRRVIAVYKDLVFYSSGSDRNSCCKIATLYKWGRLKGKKNA